MDVSTLQAAKVHTRQVKPRAAHGTTIAFLGDSNTAGDTGLYNYGAAFPPVAMLMSGGRLTSVGFHGLGGETSAGGVTRVGTALAKRPTYLHVLYGTNDIGQGIQAGQTDSQILQALFANIRTICERAEAAGAVPVLGTVPPQNDGGQRTRCNLKANIWLRRYAALKGYPLVDYYTLLAKDGIAQTPAGNGKTEYAQDGTHFTNRGYAAMAKLLVDTLTTFPYARYPTLVTDRFDTTQALYLLPNSLWTSHTAFPNKRPDNTSVVGAPVTDANTVYSLVTDSVMPGNVQQIAFNTSATTQGGLSITSGTTCTAGDVIALAGYFDTDGVVGGQVQLIINGSTTYKPFNFGVIGIPITRGIYSFEVVAPVGGSLAVQLLTGTPAGTAGVVKFGYPTLINLTAAIGETVPLNAN
jgi:lysophospholipase L1-like esterase